MKNLLTKKIINGSVLALSSSLIALFFQIILQTMTTSHEWLFFYFAIFISAWFSGPLYGYIATVTSCLLALYFLVNPAHSLSFMSSVSIFEIGILAFMGFTTSYMMGKVYERYIEAHIHSKEMGKFTEYLDLLIENMPLMVFVKDAKDLKFLRFNKAGEDLLGITKKDLLGKSDYDFFPKHQADSFIIKDREVISGKVVVDIKEEIIQSRTNGTRILHTKKIPLFGKDGNPLYLLGVSEDITEKKINEDEIMRMVKEEVALKERELIAAREAFLAKVSTMLSASLDYHETLSILANLSVTALGDWCTISIVNEAGIFERAAGAHIDNKKTVLVQEYILNFPPDQKVFTVLNDHSYFDPKINQDELRKKTSDPRRWELLEELGTYSCMIVPIRARGKIRGSLAFMAGKSKPSFNQQDLELAEDLGRRAGIAIENALLYSSAQSAIRARDEFVSIASHELKTPITSLKMQLQMMIRGVDTESGTTPSPEKLMKSLTSSNNQVDRLTALIEDLLDVTRIETGKLTYKFEEVDLSSLVREVDERFTEEIKKTKCSLLEDIEDNVIIFCDRYRIEQVLANLISNAIKYGANGTVTMTVRKADGRAEIFVKDSGMGIAKEMQAKIFERFERAISSTNISGLGLGLYIAKQIIGAHQGFIEVESELGVGSTFKVCLPTGI
ncbi:MAG: PAS domain-containing protein [Bacteriovorax sp.]|nr:PAS domain-containing protein [Bacteriovorax sp.]